jgi:hypothetical protein
MGGRHHPQWQPGRPEMRAPMHQSREAHRRPGVSPPRGAIPRTRRIRTGRRGATRSRQSCRPERGTPGRLGCEWCGRRVRRRSCGARRHARRWPPRRAGWPGRLRRNARRAPEEAEHLVQTLVVARDRAAARLMEHRGVSKQLREPHGPGEIPPDLNVRAGSGVYRS